ncbi:PD-(D/E)XK nuclease family protein [Methanococcus aeolicus]|uniref:PD-(D/E)XK nuclease family protein n=1 Tax=Methanococcus aeolicus TaxID=42879 RepID=UPI0021C6C99E|nr:PD-(D/E)XK nuclease family protein [Methanococcus aeolicus]UXM84078.1 PD-(D/E)XK nuclease family protein [Methanococcus aeolicus]
MMELNSYKSLKIKKKEEKEKIKQRYSITADILSYQLCKRQYGFNTVKGFSSTQKTQAWHGDLIHQVLSMLHRRYLHNIKLIKGGLTEKDPLPTEADVEELFNKANETLKSRGIIPISKENDKLISNLKELLKKFNKIEGKHLYPKIIDTEVRLQADMGDYLLYGVMDVIAKNEDGEFEIWDYKGMLFPSKDEDKLKKYEYQMLIYGELLKQQTGSYPSKCVLYFVNELNRIKSPKPKYIIDFKDEKNIKKIKEAMENFSNTVKEIEKCKELGNWNIDKPADKETCSICDLRWGCPVCKKKYPLKPL